LRVLGRRADGFHELQSLVAFADCGDSLSFTPGGALALDLAGPFAEGLGSDANLVMKAARAAMEIAPTIQPGRFALDKRLPVASGLGGGSSDAAAALRLLAEANPGCLSDPVLGDIADALGSDIRVCLHGGSAWMEGRGERVTPAHPLPEIHAVLANPGVAVSTAAVFGALERDRGAAAEPCAAPGAFRDAAALAEWLGANPNDLEPPAKALAPAIASCIAALAAQPRGLIARMSGSGATCFALFGAAEDALAAAARLRASHSGWWIEAARLS
jgi:4-diphosphocytidyl-2-C-methyl-D-erythritol kinase